MSTELIVLRAFLEDRTVAEEMLARGFRPDLFSTREGREVAQVVLDLRKGGETSLDALRRAVGARGRVPAPLRKYIEELKKTPRYSPFHAVMHLLLLKLDWAMQRVDRACGGAEAAGGGEKEPDATDAVPAETAASGSRLGEQAE